MIDTSSTYLATCPNCPWRELHLTNAAALAAASSHERLWHPDDFRARNNHRQFVTRHTRP